MNTINNNEIRQHNMLSNISINFSMLRYGWVHNMVLLKILLTYSNNLQNVESNR